MESILEIAKKIKLNGGELYLVGGAVRDKILNREVHDEDYCVVGLSAEKFKEIFPKAIERGKSFFVFELYKKEFAIARKEIKIGVGHKKFEIIANEGVTIEEDLSRRDITINSIAQNVLTGEIIDIFNGKKDLKNKIIRATTEKFKEDPLRVYRVARFASQLEFEVDKNTLNLMNKLKTELKTLPKERVFEELKKALQSNKPSIFFKILKDVEVLDVHFKEIYDLIGSLQSEKYHPEGDSFNHTMIVLDKASEVTKKLEIRFGALVHDLGKGTTPKEMYPDHSGHDERGVELVNKLGDRTGVPKLWINCGKLSAKEHMNGGRFGSMTPSDKVSFIERICKTQLGLEGLEIIVNADRARGNIYSKVKFAEIGEKCIQEINGEYIKQKYGKEVGEKFAQKLHEERVIWMKKYY